MADPGGYRKEGYSGEGPTGREDKHSRMGIASFILFVFSVLLFVGGIALFTVTLESLFQNVDPQTLQDPQSIQNPEDLPPELREQAEQAAPLVLLTGIGFLGAPLLALVGLGFGIAGLIQQRRKRVYAGLGTILNGLALLALVTLFLLALVGASMGVPAG